MAGELNKNKGDVVLIKDQYYLIRIVFYNTVTKKPLSLPFKIVDSLVIEESLTNWWTKGWIILKNDFEVIERSTTAKTTSDTEKNQNITSTDAFFVFRHDGRNRINIKIETLSNGNSLIKPETWTMDYDFVVYDVEDIETNSATSKLKKIYFIDERYQILSERNIPWSTSIYGPASDIAKQRNVSVSYLTDIERKWNANESIKSIIKTAACNDFTLGKEQTSELKVGFDSGGSIDNPNLPFDNIDDDNWTITNTNDPNNLVFYTSPANSKAIDDIEYMMDYAKGFDNDPVFLRIDRYTKKWSLISLSDIFSKAKQIERMTLQDGLEPQTLAYIARAALFDDNNEKILNIFSGRTSVMKNYKFAAMAPVDDMRLINRPTHTMDFSTGTYSIHFEENKAEKIFENLETLGKKGLYSFLNNTNGPNQIWLNINKTKLQGLSVENAFYTQGPPDMMMVKMLKDAIFLNQALYFQTEGLTLRQPGTFLFIDRSDSSDKNAFDDKFLGQWLINKVVHYFDSSKYITDVYANKIDGLHNHWSVLDDKNW